MGQERNFLWEWNGIGMKIPCPQPLYVDVKRLGEVWEGGWADDRVKKQDVHPGNWGLCPIFEFEHHLCDDLIFECFNLI